jgi:peroxiredoxin
MLKPGQSAPEFALPDLEGRRRTLGELIGGGPVLLAFYKVSCPTCQFTLPFLERASVGGRLAVWGVSQDKPASTSDFVEHYGLTFPTLIDPASEGYVASNAYRLTHVPAMYLVEPDGRISWASNGFVRAELDEINKRFDAGMFAPGEKLPERKPG